MTSSSPADVAYQYTVRFYPRWFTWVQTLLTPTNNPNGTSILNRLAGPLGMGPEYKIVVAINDDTIYCQAFLDLSQGPMVLTMPAYTNHYSILQLDVYGNVLSTWMSTTPPSQGGSFAFYLEGQPVPLNVDGAVQIPYPLTVFILRIDKYVGGADVITDARAFRESLYLRTQEEFQSGAEVGKTFIAPLFNYAPSVKMMADLGLAAEPEAFLTTLQAAMADPSTQPITSDDQSLIQSFTDLFTQAKGNRDTPLMAEIIRGAQAAHASLISRWQSNRGATNWIHFDNVGHWGTNYLDRAALTEYIQYGNDLQAAYYAMAFVDDSAVPLDGADFAYRITFTPDNMPQCTRFWSITAYTPGPVELVPNSIDKYVVASYTPGLVTDENGEITVYVQATAPRDGSTANWLPVPEGAFNLMLRIYGPQGTAADGTYLPPKIRRVPRV